MIALISSVPEEGTNLIKQLKEQSIIGGKPLYKGRISGKDILYMVSGMGKTNAAHAATILIERVTPSAVILFGIGGAYPSTGLAVGDIAVAEKEVYGDEGVLIKSGFRGTDFISIPLVKKGRKKYFNEFPLNKKLIGQVVKVCALLAPHPSPFAIKKGTFVTVSTCTGTREKAQELKRRYDAVCENMEGAAVAHICALYGIPMLEIRGISNIVEERNKGIWDRGHAAKNCQAVVMEVLKNLS